MWERFDSMLGRSTVLAYPEPMSLDPRLLEILACPSDKGPLYYIESESCLLNPRLKLRYRIDDGIPVMLIDEADSLDKSETDRLLELVKANGIELTFDPAKS